MEAIKFFMSKGWTLPQAIGIVSNLIAESGLNAGAVNATGHVGVAQWDQHRQMLYQMRTGRPLAREGRMAQLENVDYELRHNESAAGDMLRQSGSADLATRIVDRMYERSEGTDMGSRLANARALGSNPNITNADFGHSYNQTNNVTINATGGPDDMGRAWDEHNRKAWSNLQLNTQGAVQ